MLKIIENKIIERNAQAIKYLKAVGVKDAQGILEINSQIENDFGLFGPFTLSAISRDIHALRWANMREVFIVETNVKRVIKETVATAVAQINNCPYCEDVHATSISSAGDDETSKAITNGTWENLKNDKIKSIIDWSLNTKNPNADIIKHPPFSKQEAPEIIGTALAFHSMNRLVNIFLEASPLPKFIGSAFLKKAALNIASKTLFKSIVTKKVKKGESLKFLKSNTPVENHNWAKAIPAYLKILNAESQLLEELEKEIIPPNIAEIFKTNIKNWNGTDMPMGRTWLNEIIGNLSANEKPIATLIFLSAFAPYAISEKDIESFRKIKNTDKELLGVCYWSVQLITNRISEWLIKPFLVVNT